ncbi:endopeptidase La [Lachnospira hominis (ex Liu et al. 2021)]|jgi:endopeptidase La|uniref:Lon protease n=1 Tax=Lachnospira hominis (ex Liu et al. 2021) TaxID=2763051 RepID=A0ABR7G0C6_9FIRM|nr:endopeptidase La [Lachnospira hominis]MBC5680211.1 endopeptidase La [Lachnospira hominis]
MKKMVLPTIALRGMTVLPDMVIHFDINRKKSIHAVEKAMQTNETIFLLTQKDIDTANPVQDDLYSVGTVAKVKELIKLPKGIVRVLVAGKYKGMVNTVSESDGMLISDIVTDRDWFLAPDNLTQIAMIRSLNELICRYAAVNQRFSKDILKEWLIAKNLQEKVKKILADYPVDYTVKQKFLEMSDVNEIYEQLARMFIEDINIFDIKKELEDGIKEKVEKNQKEYYLREQLKYINEELDGTDGSSEIDEYMEKLESLNAADEIKEQIEKEIRRYKVLSQGSSEANVERGYIETLLSLPWENSSQDSDDIENAAKILDENHYGMKKVKERILETLAVRKVSNNADAPIICLVGPPGTGKTSIARSVAQSLNKEYVRICLGGVKDEAEIRGHRRTYVGAMPGRIIDGLRKAKVKNPLMLLDEIDKVSNDYRSDTSSALLEVLDGEQNSHFVDHYIDMPVDLSEILFIATANDLSDVSRPLLDRMEIIEVSSYTKNEKLHIAKEHLVAKQLKKNGLTKKSVRFTDKALAKIIDGYTMEAGVRELERMIAAVLRKVVRKNYTVDGVNIEKQIVITDKNLSEYLGKVKFIKEKASRKNEVGIVRGLAWTAAGGDTLEIEVNVLGGKPELILTGNMGDVMRESAQIALSYVRSVVRKNQIFEENAIHIHIPEGAVPKDGPSAGITMATAIYSAVTGKPVDASTAMTGEVTLRGRVMPIGGLKEKLLAAKTAGLKRVLVPLENKSDVEELEEEIVQGLEIVYVSDMKEVLKLAIVK